MGNLIVGEVSLELVEALQPLVSRIKRQDRSLADQLVRAASSISLNIAEADYSDPGNKRSRLFTAAGSANEVRAAVRSRSGGSTARPKRWPPPSNCSTASSPCSGSSPTDLILGSGAPWPDHIPLARPGPRRPALLRFPAVAHSVS